MRWGFRLVRAACHALPLLALVASAAPALAQPVVCHPIRRGESAGQAARRVTGDSRNAYSASFQIMNGSSRFVPKSQYNRVHAGWRACVVSPSAAGIPSRRRDVEPPPVLAVVESATVDGDSARATVADADHAMADQTIGAPVGMPPPIALATPEPLVRFSVAAQPASAGHRGIDTIDLTIVWLGTVIAVPWVGLRTLDGYLTRRRSTSVLRQLFANRFIAEFERPLVRYDDTESPLKTHVRRARGGRFDILLAPGPGRRYPNLTDHKRNVEYDVDRVLQTIDDEAFVMGALYAQDEWVVLPFKKGLTKGRARVSVRSEGCKPSLSFAWGEGSYVLQ